MNENERDTLFQGFAKLLTQEIDEQVGTVIKWELEHDIDSQEKIGQELYSRWQTVIAQRAYDLVMHTLMKVDLPEYINDIPDLTEWPEPFYAVKAASAPCIFFSRSETCCLAASNSACSPGSTPCKGD